MYPLNKKIMNARVRIEGRGHNDAAQNHNFIETTCSVMTKGFLFCSILLSFYLTHRTFFC